MLDFLFILLYLATLVCLELQDRKIKRLEGTIEFKNLMLESALTKLQEYKDAIPSDHSYGFPTQGGAASV